MPDTMTPREKVEETVERFANEMGDVIGNPSGYADAILAALASSGDHAELAKECVAGLQSIEDRICSSDPFRWTGGTIYAKSIRLINALLAEIAALRAEHVHLVEQKEGAEDALFNALSRATEAERKLAEAERENDRLAYECDGARLAELEITKAALAEAVGLLRDCLPWSRKFPDLKGRITIFLSKEAERG
jgi:hypothetical protein